MLGTSLRMQKKLEYPPPPPGAATSFVCLFWLTFYMYSVNLLEV